MSTQVYINLPVKDLNKSIGFFSALGYEFNPQFTDDSATCMIVDENIFVMLLVEEKFKGFTNKEIADATKSTEAIIALSADSREEVDELVNKAKEAGGSTPNDKQVNGFMYGWGFEDLDGHLWEVIYMDETAMAEE